ncbi:PREDICTED: uncharacterized protein LOC109321830 [Crocodylus porosus]|uniref:uncharacterized protein LOC109321830 n=1 Tax=Crocodylus porosus TaxID=8502 RepID=UPI000940205E|nr:PREDICTED: uncharacterized protein LOC109321830 [Crocodylus porosus]
MPMGAGHLVLRVWKVLRVAILATMSSYRSVATQTRPRPELGPGLSSAAPFWELLGLLSREPGMDWLRAVLVERGATEDVRARAETGRGGSDGPGASSAGGPVGPGAGDAAASSAAAGSVIGDGAEKNPLGPWPLKTLDLLEHSVDVRMWQAYHTGLVKFLAFRENMGMPPEWPIPLYQSRGFVVAMESLGLPSPKILIYLAALSYLSKLTGHTDPLEDIVNRHMVIALRQRDDAPRGGTAPVTIEVLRSILGSVESVCSSQYECLLFRAVFTVAFFGALRVQEMVAEHQNWAQPELLFLSDLQLTEERANLRLRTSFLGQERFLISLGLCGETWVCPVEALWNYVAARPRGEGPLFVHSEGIPLTKRQFLAVFRSSLRLLGLRSECYGAHSFWLGTTVTLIRSGYSEEDVTQLARWPCKILRRT